MSAAFRDASGKRWHVPLDVALAERVRDELEFDLLAPAAVPRLLAGDPVLTFRVLSVLLADRIAPSVLSKLLKGESITAAASAIVEAITDFFLPPRMTGPKRNSRISRCRARWNAATGSPVLSA